MFSKPARKTNTTQEIQLGLLELVAQFHKQLADEKTWIGTHPFRVAGYSALTGIGVGLLTTTFIPALSTMVWQL